MPISFTCPIRHGTDQLHSTAAALRRRPLYPTGLAIETFNIRNEMGFGLAQAARAVELGGFDFMIPTKTNISTATYFRNRLGYNIVCSTERPTSTSGAQVGLSLVSWDWSTGWSLEFMHFHGLNRISCEVVTGKSRNPIVGAYLPPTTLINLPDIEEALERFRGQYPIVLGDINV